MARDFAPSWPPERGMKKALREAPFKYNLHADDTLVEKASSGQIFKHS